MDRLSRTFVIPLLLFLFSIWLPRQVYSDVHLEIIVDGSGSMWEKIDEAYKIVIVREALTTFIQSSPEIIKVGLRTFGALTKENNIDICRNTKLIYPIKKVEKKEIKRMVHSINPTGRSPIAFALKQAFKDFINIDATSLIILIADGTDTCEESPCEWIMNEINTSVPVSVYTIGLNIIDNESRKQLSCYATNFNGKYYEVNNPDTLLGAINEIVKRAIKNEIKRLEIAEEEKRKKEEIREKTRVAIEISNDLNPILSDSIKIENVFIDGKVIEIIGEDKIVQGDKKLIYNQPLQAGNHVLTINYLKIKGNTKVSSRMERIEFFVKEGSKTVILCSANATLLSYGFKNKITIN